MKGDKVVEGIKKLSNSFLFVKCRRKTDFPLKSIRIAN